MHRVRPRDWRVCHVAGELGPRQVPRGPQVTQPGRSPACHNRGPGQGHGPQSRHHSPNLGAPCPTHRRVPRARGQGGPAQGQPGRAAVRGRCRAAADGQLPEESSTSSVYLWDPSPCCRTNASRSLSLSSSASSAPCVGAPETVAAGGRARAHSVLLQHGCASSSGPRSRAPSSNSATAVAGGAAGRPGPKSKGSSSRKQLSTSVRQRRTSSSISAQSETPLAGHGHVPPSWGLGQNPRRERPARATEDMATPISECACTTAPHPAGIPALHPGCPQGRAGGSKASAELLGGDWREQARPRGAGPKLRST